jgi:hypothetical protein
MLFMVGAAEFLLLLVVGWGLFRLARPIRNRLERWFASLLPRAGAPPEIRLRRRRDGSFGPEDADGDD